MAIPVPRSRKGSIDGRIPVDHQGRLPHQETGMASLPRSDGRGRSRPRRETVHSHRRPILRRVVRGHRTIDRCHNVAELERLCRHVRDPPDRRRTPSKARRTPTLEALRAVARRRRIKRDRNGEMYAYWADRVAKGEAPTTREVSDACETTIHAARAAFDGTSPALFRSR